MGFPTRQDEAALHERVLTAVPVASADVFAAFVDPLVAAIQRDLRCDSDTARDSAIDAIFEYLGAPSSYQPSKGRLSTFLALITKRRATDRVRARSTEARREQEFGSVVELRASAPKEEIERAVVARELWHKVEQALKDDGDRAAVALILDGERYDGGFTGANIERPALQRLLADIDAGKVDIVVVYKVDRLSRSLLDFAQLLARFEEKNVGFGSTTQQFNTRDAMGRLTLNIVVSFAQLRAASRSRPSDSRLRRSRPVSSLRSEAVVEREMIADRTRDKMGAARKRGKWLGSRPPLGYLGDRERMRLVVVPDEAEQVRTMFQLDPRLGAAAEVARRISELGWQRKTTRTRAGREVGGGAWTEKDVHMLL